MEARTPPLLKIPTKGGLIVGLTMDNLYEVDGEGIGALGAIGDLGAIGALRQSLGSIQLGTKL